MKLRTMVAIGTVFELLIIGACLLRISNGNIVFIGIVFGYMLGIISERIVIQNNGE